MVSCLAAMEMKIIPIYWNIAMNSGKKDNKDTETIRF
jgi:hypothetical protein